MGVTIALALAVAAAAPPADEARIAARVARVLKASPVIDGHNDLPWELRERYRGHVEAVDLRGGSDRLAHPLQTDIARLRAGGYGAQFWSVWIPADTAGPRAVEMTLEQIDIVRRLVARYPETFALAGSAAEIRAAERRGRIAALIGVEGGHQIDGRLAVLRQYQALGVRYMTLTHSLTTDWADSATDAPRHGGLSAFGLAVIAEMNRIGMLIDLSHVAATTMRAAIAASRAPVIFSHSSAFAIDPHPRNVPDDVLASLKAKDGIVMVNVYPAFVSSAYRVWGQTRAAEEARLTARPYGTMLGATAAAQAAAMAEWDRAHPAPAVTIAQVADHVDHVARVAGHEHVGLGGDYDGIDGTAPAGMTGVDGWPRLLAELAHRGWSDAELAQLTGGNTLRVMAKAEAVAAAMRDVPPGEAPPPAMAPPASMR